MTKATNAYTALAEIYDKLMYDVDYSVWTDYISGFLSENRARKLIEAACGTGNITLQLLKKGYSVSPFDLSEEMLLIAQAKARKAGKRVIFVNQDMCEMSFGAHDAVVCACDGVNYLPDEEKLLQFFKSAYRCIKNGGILLFDMSSEYKLRNILGDNLLYEDRDELSLFWQNSYSDENKSVELSLSIFIRDDDGRYDRKDEIQVQYAYSVKRVLELIREAGFSEAAAYKFMTREEPNETTDRIQYFAKK